MIIFIFFCFVASAQQDGDSTVYKKRVLESVEINFLNSYYTQDGNNSAVGGGIGSESLTDVTPTFVLSIPLNDDDVLTIDAGVSAYSSASSSNINPFDGIKEGDPYQASSGESQSDALFSLNGTFSRQSDDRNTIKSLHFSASREFDYFSIGAGGSYTRLFNRKNTSVEVKGNVYLDQWYAIYPVELRNPAAYGGYETSFEPFKNEGRNSYSLGGGISQILSKRMQGMLLFDLVYQEGLLSTPYQRIYFSDKRDYFIQNFQLADDVEQLPGNRLKLALGSRLNYYINEYFILRTFYRYYRDDWGIEAHTASIELPVKLAFKFTVYPMYRYYIQNATSYFAPHEQHLSVEKYYTSDYDLSEFDAHQYGIGITYRDLFASFKIYNFGLKSIDLRYNHYQRSTGLSANIVSVGFLFVQQ